jgi:integrase
MLLANLFENYYRPLRLRGKSQQTCRLYGCTIRTFGKWLQYPPTVDDLSDLMLSRFLEERAATRSPYTAEKERSQLVSLARFARDRGIIPVMPEVPPAPLPERVPKAFSVCELQAIMRAAVATRGTVGHVSAGVFFAALVSVLWETAERIGAVMECLPSDFTAPHLLVRAELRKGGKRDKAYRLSERTAALVRQVAGAGRIFEWPQARTYLWSRYADIVARAGLGRGRHLSFHALRRSAASHFQSLGGDAVSLLDHSNPRITHRWYLDRRMTDTGPQPCDLLPDIS